MLSFLSNSTFLVIVGLILSLYALYVEEKMQHKDDTEETFTALCDIEAIGASCSKVFAMPQGKLLSYLGMIPEGHVLDVPNAALGVLYYSWRLLLTNALPQLTLFASTLALGSSIFLAYELTRIGDLCILCWTTHVINTILFINTVKNVLGGTDKKNKKKQL